MKTWLLILLSPCCVAWADELAARVQERTAIERVYYSHRLGQKPPFEQVSPPSLIERLVKQDLRKEAALRRAYGVTITPAVLEAEVQRINSTTRAPAMLAEIKAALGNDPAKFANSFARRFLVERLLREKFENDNALHASQRQACEAVRGKLLATKANGANLADLLAQFKQAHSDAVTETAWELGARPMEAGAPTAEQMDTANRFGSQAQVLSAPSLEGAERKLYFEDLPAALQRVLRVQLSQPGDMSAVIETPGGFLFYVCQEKTDETLRVTCLSLRKRSYEQWLADQAGGGQ